MALKSTRLLIAFRSFYWVDALICDTKDGWFILFWIMF